MAGDVTALLLVIGIRADYVNAPRWVEYPYHRPLTRLLTSVLAYLVTFGNEAMLTLRPRLKQCFRYEVIPLEGVVFMYERGQSLLPGNVYIQLVPLLDGQHTVDEIFACLQDKVPAVEVLRALATLQSKNLIVDIPLPLPSEQAAFWDMADVNVENVVRRLRETTISIASFGGIDPIPFQAILTSFGIRVGDNGEYWAVL